MAITSVVCQHHWLNESRPNSCQTLCYTSAKSDVVPPQTIIPHKGIFFSGNNGLSVSNTWFSAIVELN